MTTTTMTIATPRQQPYPGSRRRNCCGFVARLLISLLYLALLLAALAAIGLLIWIRFDKHVERELRDEIQSNQGPYEVVRLRHHLKTGVTVVWWVLLGLAVASGVIGLLGFAGGIGRLGGLIGLALFLLLLLALLELAIGIFVIAYGKTVHEEIARWVGTSYMTNSNDRQALQYRFNCCGADGLDNSNACPPMTETCTQAVWSRVHHIMIVAGWSALALLILEFFTVFLSFLVAICVRRT